MLKSCVTALRENGHGVTAHEKLESCVTSLGKHEPCVMAQKKREWEFYGTATKKGAAKSGGSTSREKRIIRVRMLPLNNEDDSDIESRAEQGLGGSKRS